MSVRNVSLAMGYASQLKKVHAPRKDERVPAANVACTICVQNTRFHSECGETSAIKLWFVYERWVRIRVTRWKASLFLHGCGGSCLTRLSCQIRRCGLSRLRAHQPARCWRLIASHDCDSCSQLVSLVARFCDRPVSVSWYVKQQDRISEE